MPTWDDQPVRKCHVDTSISSLRSIGYQVMAGLSTKTLPTHSFIVRVWRESRELPDASQEWRGVVEHVHTGEHHYFLDLAEILSFIHLFIAPIRSGSEDRE
jgi:hypothetical protein